MNSKLVENGNREAGPMAVSVENMIFQYPSAKKPTIRIRKLNIATGEHVFLHGPSGCGKTTLLGLLAGILEPTAGSLFVLGQPFHSLKGSAKDRIRACKFGYIFQMFNLIPYLTAHENIALPCWLTPSRFPHGTKALEQEVFRLAQSLGIDDLLDRNVTELSVGQQQRVAAARSLIGSPELIVADEPTSALDTDHREAFLKALFDQCGQVGATLIFVSHDRTLMPLFQRKVSLAELNEA